MEEFDLTKTELGTGKVLIEASAGTGKTYSLTGIILRLVIEAAIPLEEILVVTFTEAATAELKSRVRSAIHTLVKDLQSANCPEDPIAASYWAESPDDKLTAVLSRLKAALASIDKASISTIHAFCASVLKENAFESGRLFADEIVTDDSVLVEQAVRDFWRQQHYREKESGYFEFLSSIGLNSVNRLEKQYRDWARKRQPGELPSEGCEGFFIDNLYSRMEELSRAFQEAVQSDQQNLLSILNDGHLSRAKYRQNRITEMLDLICEITDSPQPLVCLLKYRDEKSGYKYISQENVLSAGYSGTSIDLERDAFRIGSKILSLDEEVQQTLSQWMNSCIDKMVTRLKKKQGVLTFDDMLFQTRDAIAISPLLVASLREQHRVALIDEFQDTDPVQLNIFEHIFDTPDHRLYCVGDPKQSIYKFRGADLDTYLLASGEDSGFRKYILSTNYRSDKGVVEAVNCLFGNPGKVPNPFGTAQIPYVPAKVPASREQHPESAVFILRKACNPPSSSGISGEVVTETLYLLQRIREIRRNPSCGFGSVAVLVNSHQQAHALAQAFIEKGIPYIRRMEKSVFTSDAAILLRIALNGILECNRLQSLKAAMATPLFGRTARHLEKLDIDDTLLDQEMDAMHQYRETWQSSGFMAMFQAILSRELTKQRLISLPGGEESLSNYLHLSELLHDHESRNHASPESLVQHLEDRFVEEQQSATDTSKMRRATDADAVAITTVHSSKGLEFDSVIIPFAWSSARDDDMDENMRKFYVATTRAKHACTVFVTSNDNTHKTALGRILGMTGKDDDIWSLAEEFAEQSGPWLLSGEGSPFLESGRGPAIDPKALLFEPHPGNLQRARITTSFSALSHSKLQLAGAHEVVEDKAVDHHDDESGIDTGAPARDLDNLLLPPGSRAGRAVHGMLETIDFQDATTLPDAITANLLREGFDPSRYTDPLKNAFSKWLDCPLDQEGFIRLSDIPLARRLNEMEFHFPLRQLDAGTIARAIGPEDWPELEAKVAGLQSLSGFMMGYVDMVFEHDNRYYIVDWKSNSLKEGYSASAVRESMVENLYPLQYLIYTVALDSYLSERVVNYQYKDHFGGVFYVYLRGFGEAAGKSVFFSRPQGKTISNLQACMVELLKEEANT